MWHSFCYNLSYSHCISSQGESYDRWNRLDLKSYSRKDKEPAPSILPQQPYSDPSSPTCFIDPNGNNSNIPIENCDINLPISLIPLEKVLDHVLNILFITLSRMIIYLLSCLCFLVVFYLCSSGVEGRNPR